jgi:hypothetical protein
VTTKKEMEKYVEMSQDGEFSLHERVTIIETDVKSLKVSVTSVAASIEKVATQFENLATEIRNFMVLWQNAVPIKLVLVMFGILCGSFFGAEVFKAMLRYVTFGH